MAGFNQMGGVPDFYSQILNSAQQQLVRMPDGTYRPAPQTPASEPLSTTYGGMYGSAAPNVPNFPAYEVGADGSGARSASVGRYASANASLPPRMPTLPKMPDTRVALGPNGSINNDKGQARLNPGTALAFAGEEPPGIAAIGSATANLARPWAPWANLPPRLPSMQWEPATPSPLDPSQTDPWASTRFGVPTVPRQGMMTGARMAPPVVRSPVAPHPGGLMGLFGGLFGGGMGGQPAPSVPSPPPQAPNYAGGGPVVGVQQGTSGYHIYNGDNGVPGNSGNWFNSVTGRG